MSYVLALRFDDVNCQLLTTVQGNWMTQYGATAVLIAQTLDHTDRGLDHHRRLVDRHPSVGVGRNIGLFGMVDVVRSRSPYEPMAPCNGTSDEMKAIGKFLRDNGMYTMLRWNGIHTNPPLIITEEQLAEGFDIIDRALDITDQAVHTQSRPGRTFAAGPAASCGQGPLGLRLRRRTASKGLLVGRSEAPGRPDLSQVTAEGHRSIEGIIALHQPVVREHKDRPMRIAWCWSRCSATGSASSRHRPPLSLRRWTTPTDSPLSAVMTTRMPTTSA